MRARDVVSSLVFAMAAACATPGQVRRVETRIAMMETENKRVDSARAAADARILAAIQAVRTAMTAYALENTRALDSLRQADRNFDYTLKEVDKKLYVLQELAKASAAEVARAVAAAEQNAKNSEALASRDSTQGPVLPGDEQLLSLARSRILSSLPSEARNHLRTLLTTYPSSSRVPRALYLMGTTFLTPPQPDSQRYYFKMVYDSFPGSEDAPQAVFKLATLADTGIPRDKVKAREWFTIVVTKYPNAPEVASAREWLKQNP